MNDNDYYSTKDLPLAAAMSYLGFAIEALERTPGVREVYFLFKHTKEFEKALRVYLLQKMRVEPRRYFDSVKAVKTRLYE